MCYLLYWYHVSLLIGILLFQENELVENKKKYDDQLLEVSRQLIALEATLKKSQKDIQKAIKQRDYIIKQQQQYINKLTLQLFVNNRKKQQTNNTKTTGNPQFQNPLPLNQLFITTDLLEATLKMQTAFCPQLSGPNFAEQFMLDPSEIVDKYSFKLKRRPSDILSTLYSNDNYRNDLLDAETYEQKYARKERSHSFNSYLLNKQNMNVIVPEYPKRRKSKCIYILDLIQGNKIKPQSRTKSKSLDELRVKMKELVGRKSSQGNIFKCSK